MDRYLTIVYVTLQRQSLRIPNPDPDPSTRDQRVLRDA